MNIHANTKIEQYDKCMYNYVYIYIQMKNIMISSRASPQQHPTSPHEAATSRDGETAGGFPAPGAGAFRPPAFGAPGAFPGAPGWGYLRMSLRMQEMYGNGLGPRALQELSQLWG